MALVAHLLHPGLQCIEDLGKLRTQDSLMLGSPNMVISVCVALLQSPLDQGVKEWAVPNLRVGLKPSIWTAPYAFLFFEAIVYNLVCSALGNLEFPHLLADQKGRVQRNILFFFPDNLRHTHTHSHVGVFEHRSSAHFEL